MNSDIMRAAMLLPLLAALPAYGQTATPATSATDTSAAPAASPADASPVPPAIPGDTPAAPMQPAASPIPPPPEVNGLQSYFDTWDQRAAWARATQPNWSSPLVTTTSMLEQRFRFETDFQHSGNDTDTTVIDGGKGLDLIVGDTEELQIALPPYYIRTADSSKLALDGWADWSIARIKQRLLSSPADEGDYILTAWLQVGVPTGVEKLTSHAVTLSPTLGFGKGWGPFVIQGSLGGQIPTAYEGKLGNQIVGNLSFQYNIFHYLWPDVEVNWTNYQGGPRAGLSQVFITPSIAVARIPITHATNITFAVGYQVAVAPTYQAKPLTPAYDRAWILSTRVNF